MSQRPIQAKPKRRFLRRALLALAISAGLFFYAQKDPQKKETERIAERAKAHKIESTRKRRIFRSFARKYSQRMDLQKIIDKARDLPNDLDYDSFDCPLVGKEVDPLDKRMSFIMFNTPIAPLSDPGSSYGFYRFHSPPGYFNQNEQMSLNSLGYEIEALKRERDAPGLVRTLAKFHKLNLVWEGERRMESLADVYLDMYDKAKQGGPAPDLRCVIKNIRAIALMQDALSALERMVCSEYSQFRSSFAYMPESLLRQVSLRCFIAQKMDVLEKEIKRRFNEYDNPRGNIARFFRVGGEFFFLTRIAVEASVSGFKAPGFKRFYSGEKMDGDSILGKHDSKEYELLMQSVAGPIKYGVAGSILYPEYFQKGSMPDAE